jgi:antitoxin PrlF
MAVPLPWYYDITMSLSQPKNPPQRKARSQSKAKSQPKPVPQAKSLPQSKITAQGQISLPADIRRELGLSPGSVLEWEVKDNTVVGRKKGKYTSEDIYRRFFANRPVRHHTLEELKQAIGDHLAEKHARR